jgi:phytoene dehydrogenase-like protein
LEKLAADPRAEIDPSWQTMTPLEVLRDVFESDAFIAFLQKGVFSALSTPSDQPGMGLAVFLWALGIPYTRCVIGGTHSWAHAAVKIFLADGGKIFNEREVEKAVIENGKAQGIMLSDGSRIEAKKMVISTLDPYSLCFKLIGKDHFNRRTLRRIENLERRDTCITWYTWALHEMPQYTAAIDSADINATWAVQLMTKDPEALARIRARRLLNVLPGEEDLGLMILNYGAVDNKRAPEGKCTVMTEQFVLPANALSEDEWLSFKKTHAEDVMRLWSKHAPNMNWDNVIGYAPLTPYDHCRLTNMAPTGCWSVLDNSIPSQWGRNRPVPELAHYRSPIENMYATGSGWPPLGIAANWNGYNCYKVIAEDFGLRKPWEEKGRPW